MQASYLSSGFDSKVHKNDLQRAMDKISVNNQTPTIVVAGTRCPPCVQVHQSWKSIILNPKGQAKASSVRIYSQHLLLTFTANCIQ